MVTSQQLRILVDLMKPRLASMFLLLVLFGGAFAGVPLQFADNSCSMGGMMDADCCKAALLQAGKASLTQQEELLCALDCAQNSTAIPASSVVVLPPPASGVTCHTAVAVTLPVIRTDRFKAFHSPPGSPPTYLRHLALLI